MDSPATRFDVVQMACCSLHCQKNTETFGHSFVDVDLRKTNWRPCPDGLLKNHTPLN